MMSVLSLALLLPMAVVSGVREPAGEPAQVAEQAPAVKDPRRQPLTLHDALFVIRDVVGGVVPIEDLDGDGKADLAVGRGGGRDAPSRIDVVSSRDGCEIRTLWSASSHAPRGTRIEWDAGADVDGDGASDLLIGCAAPWPGDLEGGELRVVSGRDGTTLRRHLDASLPGSPGDSFAFLDDMDRDGCAEYVVSTTHPEGRTTAYSGRDGSVVWQAEESGAFEAARVAPLGDLDGDRIGEVLVHFGPREETVLAVLGGGSGRTLRRWKPGVETSAGDLAQVTVVTLAPDGSEVRKSGGYWGGRAGDLDRDGVEDLFLDHHEDDRVTSLIGGVRLVSGKTFRTLSYLSYPDLWPGEHGRTAAMGDMDGDGHADVALGDGNFNLGQPADTPEERERLEGLLDRISLEEALELASEPWMSGGAESGCALLYSGRTREVILGVWGPAYSRAGLGVQVVPLPDVSGDGHPDLLVCDYGQGYVFAGPGPTPE